MRPCTSRLCAMPPPSQSPQHAACQHMARGDASHWTLGDPVVEVRGALITPPASLPYESPTRSDGEGMPRVSHTRILRRIGMNFVLGGMFAEPSTRFLVSWYAWDHDLPSFFDRNSAELPANTKSPQSHLRESCRLLDGSHRVDTNLGDTALRFPPSSGGTNAPKDEKEKKRERCR